MALNQKIPRSLDEPARILGLAPLELAACALSYSILSPLFRGVPFSALLCLGLSLAAGTVLLILNRTYPPYHGVFFMLRLFRPRVTGVMSLGGER